MRLEPKESTEARRYTKARGGMRFARLSVISSENDAMQWAANKKRKKMKKQRKEEGKQKS